MSYTTSTEVEPPGRRERKKLATREALHQAARALAEERGLANVTIEAITDRVDVAPRTFFNHYSSKEEAVLGSDTERIDRVCAALQRRLYAGDDPLTALRRTLRDQAPWRETSDQLRRRIQMLRDEPMLFSVAAAQWEEMSRRMATLIAEATGVDPDTHLFPLLVVNTAIAAARTAMLHWSAHPEHDLAALIDAATGALAAGLPRPTTAPAHTPSPEGAPS